MGEVIFLPASQVLDARIFNLSRSPPLWMNTTFDVDIGVSAADIEHLQTVMSAHIDSDGTNYTPGSFSIFCRDMHDPLKVHVMCFYQLAFNASEFDRKLKANSRFLLALQIALMDINFSFAGTDGMIFKCEERLVGPPNASTPRRASRVLAAGRHNSDLGAAGAGAGSRRVSVSHDARAPGGAGETRATRRSDASAALPVAPADPSGIHSARRSGRTPATDRRARARARRSARPRPPERHDSIGDIAPRASRWEPRRTSQKRLPRRRAAAAAAAAVARNSPCTRTASRRRVSTSRGSGTSFRRSITACGFEGGIASPVAFDITRGCFATCARWSRSTRTRDS